MKLNKPVSHPAPLTHEGAYAARISALEELKRTVMACMLWEDSFYENGESISDRIASLVARAPWPEVSLLAVEARTKMNMRHVPLLMCRELARTGRLKAATLSDVIQRPDELAEFLAIYWKDGRRPLSAQVKKGLADAFTKFNEYSLAKYNRDGAVKLRDVLFLSHAKPKDPEQAALWKRLIDGTLTTPDTWEVSLSGGKPEDKRANWERLLKENKLGALALIRNLRNMTEAGVGENLIRGALMLADVSRVLPFRFIAAARHAPQWEPELEACLFRSLVGAPKLSGLTAVLVDVSGSMLDPLSAKSDMRRLDAACGLAMVAREVCEKVLITTFSERLVACPPRRGFALRDSIHNSQPFHSTYLGRALALLNDQVQYDRIIVISDEQSHDTVAGPRPDTRAYMLNVGTYKNGVAYTKEWTNISGFSESIVKYILATEAR